MKIYVFIVKQEIVHGNTYMNHQSINNSDVNLNRSIKNELRHRHLENKET